MRKSDSYRCRGFCLAALCFMISGTELMAVLVIAPVTVLIAVVGVLAITAGFYGLIKTPSPKGKICILFCILSVITSSAASILIFSAFSDTETERAMSEAAYRGNTQKVINNSPEICSESLFNAIEMGNYSMMKSLVEAGADVNVSINGVTPLELVTEKGMDSRHNRSRFPYVKAIRLLLAHGAEYDFRKVNRERKTLLQRAIEDNKIEFVKLMIEQGADLNIVTADHSGFPLIHIAMRRNNKKMALLLLEAGIDPNQKDIRGNTALQMAAERGWEDFVQILLKHGGDPSKCDKSGMYFISEVAANMSPGFFQEIFEKYIKSDWKEDVGLLIHAAENPSEKVYEYLLENGASINAKYDSGHTTLHSFAFMGHENLVSFCCGKPEI